MCRARRFDRAVTKDVGPAASEPRGGGDGCSALAGEGAAETAVASSGTSDTDE
jgi:hypothetical protein